MTPALALAATAALALATGPVSGEPPAPGEPPARVLFVGNSFTYYNGSLHKHVGNFLRASGAWQPGETRLRAMTISGSRLSEHTAGIAALVRPGDWDAVVMHGHSTAMTSPEKAAAFRRAALEHAAHIRDSGAMPVLLMTWAYRDREEMLPAIRRGYEETGRDINALVLPVGLAFDRVNRDHPHVDLYSPDILGFELGSELGFEPSPTGGSQTVHKKAIHKKDVKHPSLAGTYLAAAVVCAALFGESPVGSAYHAGLEPALAGTLQRVAAETVEGYFK